MYFSCSFHVSKAFRGNFCCIINNLGTTQEKVENDNEESSGGIAAAEDEDHYLYTGISDFKAGGLSNQ